LLTRFKVSAQQYDLKFTLYKKILTVIIESLENIVKYSDVFRHLTEKSNSYMPTLRIEMNSDNIYLVTTNPVKNSDIEKLAENIESVNNKSRDELKEFYVETITNGRFSEKGGAGLGFIEMAKTSGNDLKYSFDPISEDYSIYTFIVTFILN
jgi:hypothetical protein